MEIVQCARFFCACIFAEVSRAGLLVVGARRFAVRVCFTACVGRHVAGEQLADAFCEHKRRQVCRMTRLEMQHIGCSRDEVAIGSKP